MIEEYLRKKRSAEARRWGYVAEGYRYDLGEIMDNDLEEALTDASYNIRRTRRDVAGAADIDAAKTFIEYSWPHRDFVEVNRCLQT